MLNFCPYEFDLQTKKFAEVSIGNPDDLAYEIFFCRGYDYRSLEKTVLAGQKIIKAGTDARLEEHYNDTSTHYMLWEKDPYTGTESGIQKLKKLIESGNTELKKRLDPTEEIDYYGIESDRTSGQQMIECKKQEDGSYIFRLIGGGRSGNFMVAVPCCPSCHMRFPKFWASADDYCGISLMSPTEGGKTTFLLSMMANNWYSLEEVWAEDWTIISANYDKEGDYLYEKLEVAAAALYEEGQCPDNTNAKLLIAPVFLYVEYKKNKKMIVGIYDNSGEVLSDMNGLDERINILTNMFAHIYLIEPKRMSVELPDEQDDTSGQTVDLQKQSRQEHELMSLEEQAEYQRKHKEDIVEGRTLLQGNVNKPRKVQKVADSPLELYRRLKQLMLNMRRKDNLKEQHFACTIIKCDLLEHLPEVREIKGAANLFQRGACEDLFDEDLRLTRETIVRKLCERFVFQDKKQDMVRLEKEFESVSWHCVSALGCSTKLVHEGDKDTYILQGEYAPIRLIEPLITCIQKKIEANNW